MNSKDNMQNYSTQEEISKKEKHSVFHKEIINLLSDCITPSSKQMTLIDPTDEKQFHINFLDRKKFIDYPTNELIKVIKSHCDHDEMPNRAPGSKYKKEHYKNKFYENTTKKSPPSRFLMSLINKNK